MNVLVTGGAGYIGSHTCKRLSQMGFTPVTYDNLCRGHQKAVQWGPLVEGSLSDETILVEALRTHQIQAVLHFAAFTYVGESVQFPERYYENNVMGTRSLLKAMEICGVKNLVFSSTCAVYGDPLTLPLREDHSCLPVSPYGETKLQSEHLIHEVEKKGALHAMILRYFNASGCDPEGMIGEDHDPETHLIPLALRACSTTPLKVFGNDYATPDGTCIRDYIHVQDLADAHVLALQKLFEGKKGSTYNLGNEEGFSVREIIHAIEEVQRKALPNLVCERRPGDPPILIADSTKAKKELGWDPKITQIQDIIRTAWDWEKKR